MSDPHIFHILEGHSYMNLTTYRKSGEAVTTTVWFALVDGNAYVFTGLESGKAKRIRNNPRVRVQPSNARGKTKGASVEAEVRLMDRSEEAMADRAIKAKYGWQYRLFNFVLNLPRNPPEHVFLEVRPLLPSESRES